ncbi:hypothetical protein ACPXCG_23870 [Gordonia sp. DT218]|uniref:hypothetical protein n=1 Tax=unclassified Gordonia (in: high G+C Gram-positive bacteria) TaxID=2657482 RepID=UPI003CEBDE7F
MSEPDRGTLLEILGAHTQTPDEVIFGVWAGYASLNPNGSKLFTLGKHGYSHTEHVEPTAMAARLAAGPRLRHPGRDYVLMRGALTEADMIPALLDDYGPTLWANLVWPDDRAWCVGSEIDFDSTLVACSDETATAIVSNDLLEAFLVRPDDSLQFDADVINGRR